MLYYSMIIYYMLYMYIYIYIYMYRYGFPAVLPYVRRS